ncbi:hypothetical protein FRB93_012280 [Tulasnella sp. JGI-2019a]|nr:hypothetical protein FRB93_012280 [Tulasnella sp. JGI-2019a]
MTRADIFNSNDISGFCPGSAPLTTCTQKNRPPITKRQLVAAKPQTAAVPINMRSFTALKKSKLTARNLKTSETGEGET